ncbi:MAG TPA: substrate-binding domain-containing protein [Pseudonocardiaceae bacterium]|nr:substrate-binding domain-containing protein [Pseudonocardiaceae bacterium]
MSDQQQEQIGRSGMNRRDTLRWLGAGGTAAAAGLALAACSSGSSSASGSGAGSFPSTPSWRFVFINHVTTNSFFIPTRQGLADAAKLLGIKPPQWTGDEAGNVANMASAFDTAINGGADGIAIALTDSNAFIEPTKRALSKGIPVIAYNAAAPNNYPLAYIGQDLYQSGLLMGQRIAGQVKSGTILVGVAQPGANNLQPRLDGMTAALKQDAPGVTVKPINTGAQQAAELNAMTAAFSGTPNAAGLYAVDAGSTAACANIITSKGLQGKIHGGGFDTLPDTIKGIQAGALDFTIDQSAYMQGFLTTLHLYLYRLSGTLLKPPQTDTGLTFVTKENVAPYVASSAYEGGSSHNLIQMPGSIPLPPPSTVTI